MLSGVYRSKKATFACFRQLTAAVSGEGARGTRERPDNRSGLFTHSAENNAPTTQLLYQRPVFCPVTITGDTAKPNKKAL